MKRFVLFAPILLLTMACGLSSWQVTPIIKLAATPVSGYTVEVPADEAWGETGLDLRAGQKITIAYLSGQIVDGSDMIPDAAGTSYVCGNAGCCEPAPEMPRSALIGRVGRDIFFIGNGGELTVSADGKLELRINDCDEGLYDNKGYLKVIVVP